MPGKSLPLMEKNETSGDDTGSARKGIDYKWIVLSITTMEMFMVSVNGSITLISLPAIFNGINIDPLTSFQYPDLGPDGVQPCHRNPPPQFRTTLGYVREGEAL